MLEGGPGESAIHDASIKIEVAEPLGQALAERALAGPRRPVDRDDGGSLHCVHLWCHPILSHCSTLARRSATGLAKASAQRYNHPRASRGDPRGPAMNRATE